MEVSFSSSFKRVFKKRIKPNVNLETRFWQKLEQFIVDPFHPSLKTHKLSGKLRGLWSFSVDYDERVLFYFTEDQKAVLVDIVFYLTLQLSINFSSHQFPLNKWGINNHRCREANDTRQSMLSYNNHSRSHQSDEN